ncbi:hypothetical protein RB213_012408 [Colletotrichum asianum]
MRIWDFMRSVKGRKRRTGLGVVLPCIVVLVPPSPCWLPWAHVAVDLGPGAAPLGDWVLAAFAFTQYATDGHQPHFGP